MSVCKIEGCNKKVASNGMCGMHVTRVRRHGDPHFTKITKEDGRRDHELYDTHYTMIRRCYNKGHKSYKEYGGSGITVCDRWLEDTTGFWNFVEDMGKRPEGFTLDREDNNLGYTPDNCRWASSWLQGINRKSSIGSKSGVPGVNWRSDSKKWRVVFSVKGKKKNFGSYKDLEEAIRVRNEMLIKYNIK